MKRVFLLLLLICGMAYSVPHVYFCVKIGDQLVGTHKGFKHLMPITYVDPNDSNIPDDWSPNDSMRIPFLWFMDDSSNIDLINDICQLYDSTVYNHPVFGDSINLKRKYVLDKNTFRPQLRAEFSQKGYSKPIIDIRENIDGVVYSDSNVSLIYSDTILQYDKKRDKLLNELKLSKLFLNDPEYDSNAITQDTGTIGTSGTYPDIVGFEADLGNLTNNCWGLVISDINHNTSTQFNYNSNGFRLTITSNKYHYGCPDSGRIVTIAQDIRDNHFGINSLTIERLVFNKVAGRNWLFVPENQTVGGLTVLRQNIIKNNNIGSYCIISSNGNNSTQVYSNKFFNGPVFYYAQATGYNEQIYNNIIYNYTTGYNQFSTPTTDSSIIANNVFWNVTTPLANISTVYGFNNAWTGTGNIGFTVESGTIDQIDETFFIDTLIGECDGFNITSDSPLYRAGADARVNSNINPAINDCTWTAGAYDIGAYAVTSLPTPTIDSIVPDSTSFRGLCDSTIIYGSNLGDSGSIIFGDSVFTGYQSWTSSQIITTSLSYHDTATDTMFIITSSGDTSNALSFKFIDADPLIDSVKAYTNKLDIALTNILKDTIMVYCTTNAELAFSDTFAVANGIKDTVTITGVCYGQDVIIYATNGCGFAFDTVRTLSFIPWVPTFLRSYGDSTIITVPLMANKNDSCFKFFKGSSLTNSGIIAKTVSSIGDTSNISIAITDKLSTTVNTGAWFFKLTESDMAQTDSTLLLKFFGDEIDTTDYLKVLLQ